MMVLTAPRTSSSPQMDVDASNSADLSRQVSPTTIHLSFSSYSRCLIRDALRAQCGSSSWVLVPVSSSRFHRLRIPLP